MDVSLLAEKFLDELKNIKRYSKNTIKSYGEDLRDFTYFCNDHSKNDLANISEKLLKSFLMFLSESGLDKKSISRKLATIRGMFKYAFIHNYIDINPSVFIANPKAAKKLPSITSTESILKIYQLLDETDKDKELIKSIFEILYGCALRVSELCGLNYGDVDIKGKTVRVLGKGNKVRLVPIGDKSIPVINEYIKIKNFTTAKEPFLTNRKGERIYPRFVHRIVNKYLSKVTDIKKKSPHILRHSAATHMLDKGADLKAVKEILGHENLSTTQIYTHVSIERLKATYKKAHPKS